MGIQLSCSIEPLHGFPAVRQHARSNTEPSPTGEGSCLYASGKVEGVPDEGIRGGLRGLVRYTGGLHRSAGREVPLQVLERLGAVRTVRRSREDAFAVDREVRDDALAAVIGQ